MAQLSVLLLGPPEVRWDGKIVEFPSLTEHALTFYLASRGGMLGPGELLPLFEIHTSQTLESMEDMIARLDGLLPGLLRASDGRVGVDPAHTQVDQWEFRDLLDRAGRLPWQTPAHLPLPEAAFRLLSRALALWRSGRFLDSLSFPEHPRLAARLESTGQKLEREHSRVAERLAEHAFITGDQEQALKLALAAQVNNPFSENLNSLILRSFIATGRHAEALDYFHGLEARLRQELDTNPSSPLVEIYRSIRAGHTHPMVTQPAPGWKIRPSLQAPYVGRNLFLRELHQIYETGGGVLVLGESGQGKTRLLREFAEQVAPPPRLLLASCHPAENNLPFQPIIDLLRHQILLEEWLTLAPVWVRRLSLLLPEITALRPDLDQPTLTQDPDLTPGQMRAAIFEAVRQVFLHLASKGQLLFCLDDCQWSDEATLATVAYLLERPPFDARACLIFTARVEERNVHLETLLPALQQSSRFRLLHLTRLDSDETGELVHHVTGLLPSKQFIHRLAEDTAGNPLFILETLRVLLEGQAQLVADGPASLPLAKSLRALINTRLSQLTPAARRILEAAAILGADFDPEILTELGQQPAGLVAEALAELEQRLLIEPLEGDPRRLHYRFTHENIREILVEEATPLQRRRLHQRAAQLLENRLHGQTADLAALLARHYEACGEPGRSFTYWVQAGQRARQLYSTADAVQALSRAAALIPIVPELTDDQIYSLYADWTELAYQLEDAATIQQINEELLKLGQERGSLLLIGTALDGLSDVCLITNQHELGLRYAEQAIASLEQTTNLDKHMEAYNHRGVFLYLLSRVDAAIESFQDALTLGTGSEDPLVLRARANSHYQIAVARTLNGWPQISRQHAQRALEDSRRANRPHAQVTAYSALALSLYFLGEYDEARRASQQGLELAGRIQAWRMLGYLHAYRAMIEIGTGHIDQALEHISAAIHLGENYQHSEITAAGFRLQGDLFTWLERYDLAVIQYRRSLEVSGDGFLAADFMSRLGSSLCLFGQREMGQSYQNRASAIAEAAGQGIILLMAKLGQVLIDLGAGDWEHVKSGASQLRAEAVERCIPSIHLYAELALGETALQAGDIDLALETFARVASGASRLGHPWIELKTLDRIQATQRRAGCLDPSTGERIAVLLGELQAGVTQEPFQGIFSDYCQRLGS